MSCRPGYGRSDLLPPLRADGLRGRLPGHLQRESICSEKPAGIQIQKAEVGPTSGPTWRLSHLPGRPLVVPRVAHRVLHPRRPPALAWGKEALSATRGFRTQERRCRVTVNIRGRRRSAQGVQESDEPLEVPPLSLSPRRSPSASKSPDSASATARPHSAFGML